MFHHVSYKPLHVIVFQCMLYVDAYISLYFISYCCMYVIVLMLFFIVCRSVFFITLYCCIWLNVIASHKTEQMDFFKSVMNFIFSAVSGSVSDRQNSSPNAWYMLAKSELEQQDHATARPGKLPHSYDRHKKSI